MVLDPFCGCATACVAADKLGRKWVGIDISPKAVELVNQRLQQAPPLGIGALFHHGYVTPRTDQPRRTDIDAPINYRKNAHVLFGQQEGRCAGCGMDFPFKLFEVDHIVPVSRGGTDHIDNLQLLCGNCNRIKGNRPQEYLVARLAGDWAVSNSIWAWTGGSAIFMLFLIAVIDPGKVLGAVWDVVQAFGAVLWEGLT